MTTQFGNIEIVDDSKSIKDADIRKLNYKEVKQLDFLMKEYPHLDQGILETILRITDEQRNTIVNEIKEGDLKHEEPLDTEKYTIQSVEVE